jgi:hypothetical protein
MTARKYTAFLAALLIATVFSVSYGRSAERDLRDTYVPQMSLDPTLAACTSKAYSEKNTVTDEDYLDIFNSCVADAGIQDVSESFLKITQSAPAVEAGRALTAADFAAARDCAYQADISGLPEADILDRKQQCFNLTATPTT